MEGGITSGQSGQSGCSGKKKRNYIKNKVKIHGAKKEFLYGGDVNLDRCFNRGEVDFYTHCKTRKCFNGTQLNKNLYDDSYEHGADRY